MMGVTSLEVYSTVYDKSNNNNNNNTFKLRLQLQWDDDQINQFGLNPLLVTITEYLT